MPTTEFTDLCQLSYAEPEIEFLYSAPSEVDFSAYVISISPITRNDQLTTGTCTVVLDNGTGYFDDFMDVSNQLYGTAVISLRFQSLDESLNLFTGYVERVEMDLDKVTMYLRDKVSLCLDTQIGSGEIPVEYSGDYDPADLVWDILVLKLGLDSTVSSANVDIDYDSFVAWQAEMNDAGNEYKLNGRFMGHTAGWILKRIAELSNSTIWQKGNGKIAFSPPTGTGTIPYTKEYCIERIFTADCLGSVWSISCYYNLNTATDEFEDYYNATSSAIRSAVEVEEDRNIWHVNLVSATRYVTERLARYSTGPIRTFTCNSWLVGFLTDIASIETLFNHFDSPNNSIDIEVNEVSFDLMSYEATFIGQWIWT